jgi:hypothetical protein
VRHTDYARMFIAALREKSRTLRITSTPPPEVGATLVMRAMAVAAGLASFLLQNDGCNRAESRMTSNDERCSRPANFLRWFEGRGWVDSALREIDAAACAAALDANRELEDVRPSLESYGCEIPRYMVAPLRCPKDK